MVIGHSKQDDQRAERSLLKEKWKKDSKAMLRYQERISIHKIIQLALEGWTLHNHRKERRRKKTANSRTNVCRTN